MIFKNVSNELEGSVQEKQLTSNSRLSNQISINLIWFKVRENNKQQVDRHSLSGLGISSIFIT